MKSDALVRIQTTPDSKSISYMNAKRGLNGQTLDVLINSTLVSVSHPELELYSPDLALTATAFLFERNFCFLHIT